MPVARSYWPWLARDVVARHVDGALAELKEEAAARVADVEVAADAEEGELELVVAEGRRRADDGVIDRAD